MLTVKKVNFIPSARRANNSIADMLYEFVLHGGHYGFVEWDKSQYKSVSTMASAIYTAIKRNHVRIKVHQRPEGVYLENLNRVDSE